MKSEVTTCANRRTSGPRAQIMRKCNFYGRKNRNFLMKLGARGPQIGARSGSEHPDFMRNCNFYGRKNRNFLMI